MKVITLVVAVLAQSVASMIAVVAAMIAVVAAHVVAGDRSTMIGFTAPFRRVAAGSFNRHCAGAGLRDSFWMFFRV